MNDTNSTNAAANNSKPCRKYLSGHGRCTEDHCFNCARHLDANGHCPRKCGEGNEAADDVANNDE